jgi:transcriptional regulator with XRE-family HTH domain
MKPTLIKAVAKGIRSARTGQRMSQEELAHKSGLDRTYISGVERGIRNITLCSLEQILSALNIDPIEFFISALKHMDIEKQSPTSSDGK